MQRFDAIAELREELATQRSRGRIVALVPTMGALHAGHLALVDAARGTGALVVMSIFVNPLQFAPGEDFDRYPRAVERDDALAAANGVDVLFTPTVAGMYPGSAGVRVAAGLAGSQFEGAVRPGHFDGVLTVVAKLFHVVQPALACFGQKDIQQFTLIRQMVHDLDFDVRLMMVPTVRDVDGLALSSRNTYLSSQDRAAAVGLSAGLRSATAAWREGERSVDVLRGRVKTAGSEYPGLDHDYITVVDPDSFAPVERAEPGAILAVAARVGSTRLIDNAIFGDGTP